jgi:hypothetical protein
MMKLKTRALVLTATLALPAALVANTGLPSSSELVAKMVDAQGGKAAIQKAKTRVTNISIDFGAQGMTGTGVVYNARPNQVFTTIEIAGMGKIEEGISGDVAWSNAAMTGPQVKAGKERSQALRDANFDDVLSWPSTYEKIECTSRETVDGRDHYKVTLTSKEGDVVTMMIDAETYLPHSRQMKATTAMGEFDVKIIMSDYRPVDGIKYSHKTVIEVMGMKRVLTIDKIAHNVEIGADRFKLPAEVQALVDKDAAPKVGG